MTIQERPAVATNPKQGVALESALAQFDRVSEYLDLDPEVAAVLRVPKREWTVRFPVRMNDGQVKVFTGYRVQHNVARGPANVQQVVRFGPVERDALGGDWQRMEEAGGHRR